MPISLVLECGGELVERTQFVSDLLTRVTSLDGEVLRHRLDVLVLHIGIGAT